ncbi:pilus assembly protein PilP [Halomonas sp.]|uniref:pilus assembly protein PilP n=1 Tax=Halomonas sp. TaxID=1486246 RepID=UPI00356638BC
MNKRHWASSGMLAGTLVVLAGCADPQLGSLDRELSEIRNDPGQVARVALPEIPDYAPVPYEQADERSPFLPVMPEADLPQEGSDELAPDTSRPREPLEAFGLNELGLVGILQVGGQPSALVRAPGGQVHRLRVGNYMGNDFGRIISITGSSVQLFEVVPTGRGGWVERTTRLSLDGD